MLESLKKSFTGYLAYRGGEEHISLLLHRVTGLGVLFSSPSTSRRSVKIKQNYEIAA